jgi:hypothetical protein
MEQAPGEIRDALNTCQGKVHSNFFSGGSHAATRGGNNGVA